MTSTNEKQNQTIEQALAAPSAEQEPPMYSPVRNTNPAAGINALAPPLQTHGLSNSASSSATAINPAQATGPVTSQPLAKPTPAQSTYESWNPADGSGKDGRPPWWNRWFCCGYGVECVLCLCGSPTCWQERQRQVVDDGAKGQGKEGEKRV